MEPKTVIQDGAGIGLFLALLARIAYKLTRRKKTLIDLWYKRVVTDIP
jgi:hypothetical protein